LSEEIAIQLDLIDAEADLPKSNGVLILRLEEIEIIRRDRGVKSVVLTRDVVGDL
jgi:hypothetical protein